MLSINKQALRCPRCGSPMKPAIAVNDVESQFWMKCTQNNCQTYIDTYIPLPHQEKIHADPHRYVGIFGGYGSGKTQCTIKDDEKHMLTTPNGTTIVGSAVLSQVEETWEKDWGNDFPADFIKSRNKQKKTYQLLNGHTLLIKSYYDEELLRSLNVSRFHIVEASAVDFEIFTQLKTRLRNNTGTIPLTDKNNSPIFDPESNTFILDADWRKGIIESNPSSGWIRDDFLLNSDHLDTNGSTIQYARNLTLDPSMSSYVIPTKANIYLPPTFYEDNARNKPDWWVARYLNGSFDYAEGLVYPKAFVSFINSFDVPEEFPRLVAMDYGIRDPSAFIFGAIDTKQGIIYIIDEIYQNNMNAKGLARFYREKEDLYTVNPFRTPVMDGRSINKRNDLDLRTIGDLFRDEGIYFEAAQMDLEARLTRLNELFESYTIKIFKDKCPNLYKEITNYKFPDRKSNDKTQKGGDKPMDKNNHAVNALEFLVMEVPKDMTNLKTRAYDEYGRIITSSTKPKKSKVPEGYNPYALPTNRTQSIDEAIIDNIFIGGGNDIPW